MCQTSAVGALQKKGQDKPIEAQSPTKTAICNPGQDMLPHTCHKSLCEARVHIKGSLCAHHAAVKDEICVSCSSKALPGKNHCEIHNKRLEDQQKAAAAAAAPAAADAKNSAEEEVAMRSESSGEESEEDQGSHAESSTVGQKHQSNQPMIAASSENWASTILHPLRLTSSRGLHNLVMRLARL